MRWKIQIDFELLNHLTNKNITCNLFFVTVSAQNGNSLELTSNSIMKRIL